MYVTVYTTKKKGKTTGCAYQTKTLSAMHFHLHRAYPDAQTWENPTRVITDFIPGVNLAVRPIVEGGKLVDGMGVLNG